VRVSVDDGSSLEDVPLEHVQHKKNIWMAYCLWLGAGALGVHHFYLERIVHGTAAAWTFNFLLIGWACDAFMLPSYVANYNRGTANTAPWDRSLQRVFCRMCVVFLLLVMLFMAAFSYGPLVLQGVGLHSSEKVKVHVAQESFAILNISATSTPQEAKKAYEEMVSKLDAKLCDEFCQDSKRKLRKAYDFIRANSKSKHSNYQNDHAWNDWLDFTVYEWEALAQAIHSHRQERARNRSQSANSDINDDL